MTAYFSRTHIRRAVCTLITLQGLVIGSFWIYATLVNTNSDRYSAENFTDVSHHMLATKLQKTRNHSSYGHCTKEQGVDHIHEEGQKNNHMCFQIEFKIEQEPLISWIKKSVNLCKGDVTVYGDKFAFAKNVVIKNKMIKGFPKLAKGGERVETIALQGLDKEIYKPNPGFFEIQCDDVAKAKNVAATTHYDRIHEMTFVNIDSSRGITPSNMKTIEKFTIAIERGDYANLWNHMFEVYGVFLMLMAFKKQPNEVQVMVLDGHPRCNLDRDWETLFGPLVRVGQLEESTLFTNLVLGLQERAIPLSKWENPTCPYVDEFRSFMLNQYGLPTTTKEPQCDRLTFTVIFRRNQVYHPRNMAGNVERKIFNELDLIEKLMQEFPGVCLQALLMESIPMKAQLEIISETDVLIGMHGAGFMHSTFLPKRSGLVELFPYKYRDTRRHTIMYERMAKWRGLKYVNWIGSGAATLMDERTTIVNANEVVVKVKEVVNMICE